jgi:hypothetical protein
MMTATMPRPSRKTKGMFVFPESSIIALDTKGPTKEDVLPMIEKRAKKRNSLPRGTTSEIIVCDNAYQGHTNTYRSIVSSLVTGRRAPFRSKTYPIKGLIRPNFPYIVKSKLGLSYTDTSPSGKNQNPECVLCRVPMSVTRNGF